MIDQSIAVPSTPALAAWIIGIAVTHISITAWIVDAVIERKYMKTFDACTDRIEPRIRTMLSKDLQMVIDHHSRLTIFESRLETGLANHTSALQSGLALQTQALESVAITLDAVQKEAAKTAKAVARIEGRLSTDRRGGRTILDDTHGDDDL